MNDQCLSAQMNNAETSSLPETVLALTLGGIVAACVCSAAELGIAEHLRSGPRHIEELAQATEVQTDTLLRVMRVLIAYEIFEEVEPAVFQQSARSNYLLPDVPDSVYMMTRLHGHPYWSRLSEQLTHCVRTGSPAFEQVWGEGYWSRVRRDEPASRLFDEAMTASSQNVNRPIAEAYDLADAQTVVDVGGGQGSFLATLLARYRHLKGILFDQASPIERTRQCFEREGLLERCQFRVGNFLETVPPGGDVYFIKNTLHDWKDEACLTILRQCRQAMQPGKRLVAVERLNQPERAPLYTRIMDVYMLAFFNGHERSEDEFRALYQAAGFHLRRIIPTPTPFHLFEGIAQ